MKHSVSYFSSESILKTPPKNISAILAICDDASILGIKYIIDSVVYVNGYIQRSNPKHNGGRDLSNHSWVLTKTIYNYCKWSLVISPF